VVFVSQGSKNTFMRRKKLKVSYFQHLPGISMLTTSISELQALAAGNTARAPFCPRIPTAS